MWIVSAEQSRSLDRRASEMGASMQVLMERAGKAVADAAIESTSDGESIVVVCGKGNNGGDGMVAARYLSKAKRRVECLVAAQESELGDEPTRQLKLLRLAGVLPIFSDDEHFERKLRCLRCRHLVVDALLGVGATRAVHGVVQRAIEAVAASGAPVVSVDLPSGIHPDTGEVLGEAVFATRTVTFGLPKRCFFQGAGIDAVGTWSVADIGFPGELLEEDTGARLICPHWVSRVLLERINGTHKGANGSVLIVAGSERFRGAAALAARGALRAGAGLVTVASIPSVCASVAAQLPEVVFHLLAEQNGAISADGAEDLVKRMDEFDAAVFGPGLSKAPSVREFLSRIWAQTKTPSVVDADALNLISEGLTPPAAMSVFTPHPGEMGRLMASSASEVEANRFAAIREAEHKYGGVMVLKGPRTLVMHESDLRVNMTGNTGMATGGSGDVLSGVIGALLAIRHTPFDAAAAAVHWHGLAGDVCAERVGAFGYLSHEIADALPAARAKLMESCRGKS